MAGVRAVLFPKAQAPKKQAKKANKTIWNTYEKFCTNGCKKIWQLPVKSAKISQIKMHPSQVYIAC